MATQGCLLHYRNVTPHLLQVYDFPRQRALSSPSRWRNSPLQSVPSRLAGNSLERKDLKMKRFKNFVLDANTKHRLKRCGSALAIFFTAGLIPILAAKDKGPEPFRFSLV